MAGEESTNNKRSDDFELQGGSLRGAKAFENYESADVAFGIMALRIIRARDSANKELSCAEKDLVKMRPLTLKFLTTYG